MRWSQYYLYTTREVPADAEVVSHKLMLRAGMIRKVAAGIYTYLPFGWRSLRKMEQIVREEMDRQGAVELAMPAVQPAELWQESGRWGKMGKELLRLKDRHERDFCFGPTHEEIITDTVRKDITSHRQLPVNLYQIQTKFRDEVRPRFGLMRGREFIMKDAYSFDRDDAGLDAAYAKMSEAYHRIFERCHLSFTPVDADTGNIGGAASQEFMVLAQSGEDAVMRCAQCGYGANLEKAQIGEPAPLAAARKMSELTAVDTPGMKSVEEVAKFLAVPITDILKTLIYETDQGFVAVLIRGDFEVNEVKLKNYLGAGHLALASEAKVEKVSGGAAGFSGPLGLAGAKLVADRSVAAMTNAVAGANRADSHWVNVNPGRDFKVTEYVDLASAREGDPCPRCAGTLGLYRGIEVGHIFKLGTKYSEAMQCTFLDEAQAKKPMVMGCYGLGIGRTVAAAIEQNHDADGIIWPLPLAPFQVLILALNRDDARVMETAEWLYRSLAGRGAEVLFDDRDERAGVKFKDADLIGIPLRITVGSKTMDKGFVEFSTRAERRAELLERGAACERVLAAIAAAPATARD